MIKQAHPSEGVLVFYPSDPYYYGMPRLYEDAELPDGVDLYDLEDFDTHRNLIFNDAKNALEKQFPKEHNGVRMELSDVKYVDPERYSISDQKRALHEDKYLMRRLRGKLKLTDTKTGELLDEKDMTLMRVPYLTDRGTFIRSGNEWASIAQQRLLPGAYSRYQNNGDLETQFNVRPGTGNAFRVQLNPETAQYKFSIAGSELHLYSLLHDIGVSDERMEEGWGKDILNQNKENYDARVFEKAYNKIVPEWDRKNNPGRSREEKVELIKNALDRSQVATNVVKKTLPSLFNMKKRADWVAHGEAIEKVANFNKDDLKDVATYINAVSGTNIDTDASRDVLENQIKNVVRTGHISQSNPDTSNPGVALVQQMNMKRVLDKINNTYAASM